MEKSVEASFLADSETILKHVSFTDFILQKLLICWSKYMMLLFKQNDNEVVLAPMILPISNGILSFYALHVIIYAGNFYIHHNIYHTLTAINCISPDSYSTQYLRQDILHNNIMSVAQYKTAVSPLVMHWSYCSLALSHRYMIHLDRSDSMCLGCWVLITCFFCHHIHKLMIWPHEMLSAAATYWAVHKFNRLRLKQTIVLISIVVKYDHHIYVYTFKSYIKMHCSYK